MLDVLTYIYLGDYRMASSNLAPDNHPRPAVPLHFVPPSLLRVRGFLFEYGMPIVPWAPASEVLDQFYELMHSRSGDDRFWQGVRDLIEALQCDLQERLESDAQDNEILTVATHRRLLDEIRNQLCSIARPAMKPASTWRI